MAAKKKQVHEYAVSVPFTGVMNVFVEAENEEDAKEKAIAKAGYLRLEASGPSEDEVEMDRWEPTERIVQGNIFHGVQNEIEVEEQ